MADRFVTRTVVFASVECVVADLVSMQMERKRFNYQGNLVNKSDVLEYIQKNNNTDEKQIISVDMKTVKKDEILYGMKESDFIKYAKRMETRTKAEKNSAEAEA